ncbi:Transcription elongation factor spt6 [Malassezia nana]|uniref:Transcription elongation factor SPT6 n=1 Tax=Malassezia nana TaxID=180528 RepID=A0AAF0J0X9_9BASI|nr:Transcription elongation factor spt6 [Malassezia nana]
MDEARPHTSADDAPQPWSDEEGEDLMKESGNMVGLDSSDEDEDDDDEEEQRRVAEGFIDDNDDEEDEETSHKRKRRHRHRDLDEELDEDDLALLSENTRPAEASHKRARAEAHGGDELAHIFDDEDAGGAPADPYEDELDDFIEDDEDDAEFTGLNEEQREARRRERREERRQARMSGARVDPRKAGLDLEAWDEVHDIFGNGEDYAWALEDDETATEAAPKARMEYKDIFEPAQIRERMLTDEDDRIKQVDMPERLQLMIPGEEGLQLLERKLSESELDEAARWASTRLSSRCTAEFLDEMAPHARLRGEWHACLRQMLSYMLNDLLEVSFLMQHRLDELEHTQMDAAQQRKVTTTLLVRQELLTLSALGIKYKQLLARKDALRKTFGELVATYQEPAPELDEARGVVDELVAQAATLEEVTDIAEWLAARFGERFREATALASSHEAPVLKRPTVLSEHEQRKHTPLAQLAARLGLSSSQLAANVAGGVRQHVPEDEAVSPQAVAEEYVQTMPGAIDASSTLALARTLLAHEIGKEPALRREVRALFRLSALVDVEPTERGMTAIDEGHPYYQFKFLRAKPVSAVLQNASQFLQMVQAEEERLVTLTLRLPFEMATKLERRLQEQFVSDGMSAVSQSWNEQRTAVVEEACASFLLPLGRMWTHEWLVEECREALLRYCEQGLTQRVEGGPVQSAGMISRQSDPSLEAASRVPRVLALSHGDGDPRRSEIVAVFLDERGRLLERATFDTLRPPRVTDEGVAHDPRATFVDLLRRRRPDVVVVNGFSPRTAELKEQVQELVQAAWEERVREEELDGLAREQVRMDVVSVYDDVARLYQHSARAASEFPELTVLARYCVGLARYAQSPVNEFAALGADVVAVQFDPAQRLLPVDRLRMHLERALVLLVNDIGVDLQVALTDAYVGAMLPFVAGLGPRKAHALLHAIRTQLDGVVVNREVLVRRGLLPFHVWNNAASFLRIDQEAANDALDEEAQPDVLDTTRIHPEDYDFPRQMARDALNKHEEDLEGEHPSVACLEIMQDPHPVEKLAVLDLDQYAAMLYERRGLKKRLTLLACKQELIRPYDDWRPAQALPTTEELFTMFTGETRRTLSEGYVVPAVVYRVEEGRDMEGFLRVRLEAGIDGIIAGRDIMPGYNSRDVRLRRLFRAGQTLNAVVVQLDLHHMRAELSLRAEAFEHVNPAQGRTPVDPMYFDHERAHMESEAAEERARRRHQNRIGRRVIDHPHFHNLNAAQAQHFLATQPRGSVVVRPSSRGMDHLAVTWKVDEGVYQHIDVLELDKENEHALGRILRVADMGSYADLDDLIVNHVRPMAAMVEMMMNHEKYKGSDPAAVEAYLTNASLANPNRSVYAFGLNKERPGYFDLSFKANSSAPVQTWPVKVLPGAFKLGQATQLADVTALTNAFKTQYMAQANAARGGRTPGVHGGMTPGYYGGRTPGATYGGMTPRTAYGMGSMTPGAYGAPAPSYGMPPGPPPAMPSRGPW